MHYEIKELGAGGILDKAIDLFRNQFKMLFVLTLFLMVPIGLIQSFAVLSLMPTVDSTGLPPEEARAQMLASAETFVTIAVVSAIFGVVFVLIASPLTNAAATYGIARAYLDRPAAAGSSMGAALRNVWGLFITNVLAFILIVLGLFAFIIPGIILMFRYWLITQVVMVEGVTGGAALKRSGRLMKGNVGKAFVLGLLVAIMSAFVGGAAAMVPVPEVAIVVRVMIQALLFVFGSAAWVVFYFSARCQHENFDLTVLAESVGEGPAPAAEGTQHWVP